MDTGRLDSGFKNTGGIRDLGANRSDTPAALVLVSDDSVASGQHGDVPPVLTFHKPEAGAVRFCGLCVPNHLEVRSYENDLGGESRTISFTSQSSIHSRSQSPSFTVAPG